MQRLIPLPPTFLDEPEPAALARELVLWTQCLAVNLLTSPRPRWWIEMGLGEDFEDTAALNTIVKLSADCLSKFRPIENGAPCQDAPQQSEPGDQPGQIQG